MSEKRDWDPTKELFDTLDDLERLLKNGDVVGALTEKGVNASIAILGLDALRHYFHGEKLEAAGELSALAEEIAGRLPAS